MTRCHAAPGFRYRCTRATKGRRLSSVVAWKERVARNPGLRGLRKVHALRLLEVNAAEVFVQCGFHVFVGAFAQALEGQARMAAGEVYQVEVVR